MRLAIALMAACSIALVACGGDKANTPANETSDAAQDEAQKPITDAVHDYAAQLCGPYQAFFQSAAPLLQEINQRSLDALGELMRPLQTFREDLREVEPPAEVGDYHEDTLRTLDYSIEVAKAIGEGRFFAVATLPSPPPEPQQPEGFEPALLQECGEELRQFIDEFGLDLFGAGATPLAPATTMP